jgi:hypothetical protein
MDRFTPTEALRTPPRTVRRIPTATYGQPNLNGITVLSGQHTLVLTRTHDENINLMKV